MRTNPSAVQPDCYEVQGFVNKHGDGVKRWALEVDDVEVAQEMGVGVDQVYRTKQMSNISFISMPPTPPEGDFFLIKPPSGGLGGIFLYKIY